MIETTRHNKLPKFYLITQIDWFLCSYLQKKPKTQQKIHLADLVTTHHQSRGCRDSNLECSGESLGRQIKSCNLVCRSQLTTYKIRKCDSTIKSCRDDTVLLCTCRQFLWSFRLPGEAQKIDRMMECFAERYCELNPGVFTSSGTLLCLFFYLKR